MLNNCYIEIEPTTRATQTTSISRARLRKFDSAGLAQVCDSISFSGTILLSLSLSFSFRLFAFTLSFIGNSPSFILSFSLLVSAKLFTLSRQQPFRFEMRWPYLHSKREGGKEKKVWIEKERERTKERKEKERERMNESVWWNRQSVLRYAIFIFIRFSVGFCICIANEITNNT